jgi:hypothetical protein
VQLRAGLRVVELADDEVQVGLDPRWAVRVTGLTAAEHALLLQLRPGRPVPPTPPAGIPPERWVDLVEGLTAAGVLLPTARPRSRPLVGAAEADAWSLLDPHGDGRGRLERRAGAAVGLLGLGQTGLTVAVALAAAGVGSLVLEDPAPVRSSDVGPGGYRWSDVGATRQTVAARVVHDVAPGLSAADRSVDPDLLITVEPDVVDPVRATTVLAAGVPHLSVLLQETDVLVGPLVVPGDGPCLRCLELHRADADPAWPGLLARLVLARGQVPATEIPVLAGVAGHLAAAMALAHLDGAPTRRGLTWLVGLPDAAPRARTWTRHPECGCAGPPVVAAGQQAGGAWRR